MKKVFKLKSSPGNTIVKGKRTVGHEHLKNHLKGFGRLRTRLLEERLGKTSFSKVLIDVLRR